MAILVFTRDNTDYARRVTEFLYDFRRRTGDDIEVVDPDSPDGVELARVYDVMEHPTIVATANDGQQLAVWKGLPLPTIDEVSYYA